MSIIGVFEYYDESGDGQIQRGELLKVFKDLGPQSWSNKRLNNLFDAVDLDESGSIDYREFLKWALSETAGQKAFDLVARGAVQINGHVKSSWAHQPFGVLPGPISIANIKKSLVPKLKVQDAAMLDIVRRDKATITITLDQTGEKSHGFKLKQISYNRKRILEVQKTEDGLIKQWNAENKHTGLQVEKGDLIVEVNGASTNMDDVFLKREVLKVTVQKTIGPYTDHAFEDAEIVGGDPDESLLLYVKLKDQ